MSLTSVLEARKVAKSILKTETVRHVNEALFGELLRRYCGVVCFSSRISLVYRAVVEHYGIGRKGLDLDSFAIALLLVRRTRSTVLEGQPAFVTPTDAMIAFDLDNAPRTAVAFLKKKLDAGRGFRAGVGCHGRSPSRGTARVAGRGR